MSKVDPPLIYAVDDETSNLVILRHLLEKNGLACEGESEPEKARDQILKVCPDLVLLDVKMPGLDGFSLCRSLKEKEALADVPVIFLTGSTRADDKIRGFEAGGVDYVTKPFYEAELLARIRTHLQLRKAGQIIVKTSQQLKASNIFKNRLISIIGHDLRSPMGAVRMKLDLLNRNMVDLSDEEARREYLHDLLLSMDGSLNLLENMVGWARSVTGKLQGFPELVSLHETIGWSQRLLQVWIRYKKIDFRNEVPEDLMVYVDMMLLKAIFRNLISNALKFTFKGGTITVSAEVRGDRVWVTVADSGVGIAPKDLPKILDTQIFYTSPGTQAESGSGLGLILTQECIQVMGGTLQVTSEPGRGSRFSFDLPLNQAAS